MENFRYIPQDRELNFGIRLKSKFMQSFDRKCLLKKFCNELNIKELEEKGLNICFPPTFLIEMHEIEFLYNIRDKIILNYRSEYDKTQTMLEEEIRNLETRLDDNLVYMKNENGKLADLKIQIKSIRNSDDKIAYQERISKLNAEIRNTETIINDIRKEIISRKKDFAENIKNWGKQVELVEKLIEEEIGNYIKGATRKIERKYGYSNFSHVRAKYSEKVQKVLEG